MRLAEADGHRGVGELFGFKSAFGRVEQAEISGAVGQFLEGVPSERLRAAIEQLVVDLLDALGPQAVPLGLDRLERLAGESAALAGEERLCLAGRRGESAFTQLQRRRCVGGQSAAHEQFSDIALKVGDDHLRRVKRDRVVASGAA